MDLAGDNDGAPVGGVSFVCGPVAQAFAFDGVSPTRVQIEDTDDLRFPASFSFSAWVRTTVSGFQDILRKRHRDSSGLMDIGMGQSGDNKFRFFAINDAGESSLPGGVEGTTSINDGMFHHVVGVRDAANDTLRVYVDGQKENEQSNVAGTFVEINATAWSIGNSGLPFNMFPWTGEIDEVSIYDIALDDQEVQDLFTAGPSGRCKPYPFKDSFDTGSICWTSSVP